MSSLQHSLSLQLGFPPPIQSGASLVVIDQLLEDIQLPPAFAAQLHISRQVARYGAVLTEEQPHTFNMSAISLFESDLNASFLRFRPSWTVENELSLLRAKLSLYTLACVRHHSRPHERPEFLHAAKPALLDRQPNIEVFYLAGLDAACKLIHLMSDMYTCITAAVAATAATTASTASTASMRSPAGAGTTAPAAALSPCPGCIPKRYYSSTSFAAMFLLKFCTVNPRLSEADRGRASDGVTLAYQLFLRASCHPLDEQSRTAMVLDVLGRAAAAGHADLRVRDRHSASIIYDLLQRAAELRGREVDDTIPEVRFAEDGREPDEREDPASSSAANDANNRLPAGHAEDAVLTTAPAGATMDELDSWDWYAELCGDMWSPEALELFIEENPHLMQQT